MLDLSTFSATFRELVDPMRKAMRIVWFSFNAAIPAYIAMAYVQFGLPSDGLEPLRSNPLTVPLAVLSVAVAIGSLWVADLLLTLNRPAQRFAEKPDPENLARDPRTGYLDPKRLARIKTLSEYEQRMLSLVSLIFIPFLVRLAFAESIALYGLVLSFLSRSPVPVIPFAIVALALNLRVSPDLGSWLERVARRAGQ